MPKNTQNDDVDVAVLQLAALDDEAAWRIIMRRVYRRVSVLLGRDSPDVEDVAQHVCENISIALRNSELQGKLGERAGAWVTAVARNAAIDYLRASKTRAAMFAPAGDDVEDLYDAIAMPTFDLDDRLSLEEAVFALNDAHRAVIVLLYGDKLMYSEVAKELRIPENTVKSRAKRAVLKLRAYMRNTSDIEAQLERSRL